MIELRDVTYVFDRKISAVSNLNLHIRSGETVALLGTSGSGKSTTLKMVNGLIRPTAGAVYFEGAPLSYEQIYAARLKMGYVIQDVGLFPHLNVFENISIMGRMLGLKKEEREKRVEELLALVGLDSDLFWNKYPSQLSGGEAGRVGVARALMLDPPCLLMDEPFGALDPITRAQLQDDFLKLEGLLKKTVVLVTHDVREAFKLAGRIAILSRGRLIQCDTPETIRSHPANNFVKAFLQ